MPIRTRFAPSPTGSLHVGNARTALFNYLLARSQGGQFVLRMEDTDRVRSTEQSAASILEDLRWLGFHWDEGPDCGGTVGPYRQTERLAIYREHALALERQGLAFWCHDTAEEMEAWNARQNERKRQGLERERHPDQDGLRREERQRAGLKPALRFIRPETGPADSPAAVPWHDLFHGDINTPLSEIGDFTLLKSDGMPSYNFACVVDDHLMGITHVLRGEDGISNTPRQCLLYRAFGWQPPAFGHLGFVLGPDGGKLSKSHGSTSVGEFRAQGHLPQALVNYLGLLGLGGAARGQGSEVRSLNDLVQGFELKDVVATSAIFDFGKLGFLGGHWMRHLPLDDLLAQAAPFVAAAKLDGLEPARLGAMAELGRQQVQRLDALAAEIGRLANAPDLAQNPAAEWLARPDSGTALKAMLAALDAQGFPKDAEAGKALIQAAVKASGLKGPMFYMPVRCALTGVENGPELPRVLLAIGEAEARQRLSKATPTPTL